MNEQRTGIEDNMSGDVAETPPSVADLEAMRAAESDADVIAADVLVDERTDVERQRDEYLDSLQRLQADFENYRKRSTRLANDAVQRAEGDLVVKLLPVLDAFDLAQAHFAGAPTDEAEALNQARGLLLDTLAKEGLERIDEVGVPFDPQVHDAVAHDEGDGEHAEQVIDGVLRAGYRWKGVVVRPAMVKVKG